MGLQPSPTWSAQASRGLIITLAVMNALLTAYILKSSVYPRIPSIKAYGRTDGRPPPGAAGSRDVGGAFGKGRQRVAKDEVAWQLQPIVNRKSSHFYLEVNYKEQKEALQQWLSTATGSRKVIESPRVGREEVGHLAADAGVHDDIILKLVESHQRMQQDIVSGKEAMKRGLIATCSLHFYCGGHGDRMYGLILIYLTALLSRRAFFIDHSRPLPLENFLEPNRFEWRISKVTGRPLRKKLWQCAAGHGGSFLGCNLRNLQLPGATCDIYGKVALQQWPMMVLHSNVRINCVQYLLRKFGIVPQLGSHGFSNSEADMRKWASDVSHVLLKALFKFKTRIVDLAHHTLAPKEAAFNPKALDCMACVHVRSGSGVKEKPRHTNWRDFATCALRAETEEVLKRKGSKKCQLQQFGITWLVVGDNLNAADEIRQQLLPQEKNTKRRIMTTNELGKPAHTDHEVLSLDGSMTEHVFVDWYLLSQCHVIVASLSTFVATATLRGGPSIVRYDMETPGHEGGCVRNNMYVWQRPVNRPPKKP